MNATLDAIYDKVAKDKGLAPDVVRTAFHLYIKYMQTTISSIDFSNIESKEDLKNVTSTGSLPGLGRFYINYYKMKNLKEFRENNIKDDDTEEDDA